MQVSFNLSGSCNTNADVDWSKVKEAAPSVDVTWVLAKHVDGPVALTATKVSGSTNAISVTTFAEVKSAKLVKYNGVANTNNLTIGTHCTVSGNTFTLASSWASKITAETVITLTFEDGQTQTLTVTVQ